MRSRGRFASASRRFAGSSSSPTSGSRQVRRPGAPRRTSEAGFDYHLVKPAGLDPTVHPLYARNPGSGRRSEPSLMPGLDRESIAAAYERIAPHVRATPLVEADGADFGFPGLTLAFKLEYLQHAGSFKTRGAFNQLLTRQIGPAGVVAASGGNHGVAVSFAAMKLGVPATIFVPTVASKAKIEQIRDNGAKLVVGGDRYDDALRASEAFVQSSGAAAIHAFDQWETL